jgi:hypothetical protein
METINTRAREGAWEPQIGEVCYAISERMGSCTHYEVTISRLTKTQIIATSGTRFRRSDKREIGTDSWCPTYLYSADSRKVVEVLARAERMDARDRLQCRDCGAYLAGPVSISDSWPARNPGEWRLP